MWSYYKSEKSINKLIPKTKVPIPLAWQLVMERLERLWELCYNDVRIKEQFAFVNLHPNTQ